MPVTGANISSGMGSGKAQILQPYESKYGMEIAKIKGAEQKQRQERENDVYGDLGKINANGIFFKHQPVFAQKQSELYDWTKQNIDALRKGDPQATIQFHQKLTQLGSDIGESKGVAQSYKEAGLEYAKNPDKYRPEVLDKLHGFEGYNKDTGQFENVDPSIMQENFDIGKDVKQNVLPVLKDRFQKYGAASRDPQTGVITTTEGEKLPPMVEGEDPRYTAAKEYITQPKAYEQAHYEYMKAHPDSKPTADDIANYVYENKGFKGAFPDFSKKHLTEGWNPNTGANATEAPLMTIHYDKTANGEEYTFNKDNPTDEVPVKFKTTTGEVISGVPQRVINKSGKPILTIAQKGGDNDGKEFTVNYNDASDILKDKYNFNLYEVKNKVKPGGSITQTLPGAKGKKVYQVNQPTPIKEQEQGIIHAKSKSGKDIYSPDGGKTWLYK